MVPGSILSIDLDTHGGEKNCSEQTGYPVSQGSAPGDQGALTVQEEERLKQEKIESAHLSTSSHDNVANKKRKRNNNNKGKGVIDNVTSQPKGQ